MKKLLFAALAATLLLASCGSEADYAKFIPKDAAVVGRVDVKQMAEKGGFDADGQAGQLFKKAINSSNLSQKGKAMAEKIIADPALAGIDLRKPVYFYSKPDSVGTHFGIIATVLDKDNLNNFLNFISEENRMPAVQEYNGVTYIAGHDAIIAFTDQWLVIKDGINDNAQEAINALLAAEGQSSDLTIESNPGYQRMTEIDGLAQVVVRGSVLADILTYGDYVPNIGNARSQMADFDYIFDLKSDNGSLSLGCELMAENEQGRVKMTEIRSYIDEINCDYADLVDANALLGFITNIKGKDISNYFANAGLTAEQIAAIKPYFEALNGDVAFTINAATKDFDNLDLRLVARCNNPKPFTDIFNNLQGFGFTPGGTDQYSLELGNAAEMAALIGLADSVYNDSPATLTAYAGINNGNSAYLALSTAKKPFDAVAKPIDKGNLHGRTSYVRLNVTAALELIKVYLANEQSVGRANDIETSIFLHVLDNFDYAEGYTTTDAKTRLNLYTKDKDKEGLAVIVNQIATLINVFG